MWEADEEGKKVLHAAMTSTDLCVQLPGAGRPYARYCSNGVDAIHVVVTEDHPRNYDNSIYHGYFRDHRIHRSNGSVVGSVRAALSMQVTHCT